MSKKLITDNPKKPLLPEKPNKPVLPEKPKKPLLPDPKPEKPLIKGQCNLDSGRTKEKHQGITGVWHNGG